MEEYPISFWQDLYDKCTEIATKFHEGQVDKAGQPYIEHPKRVARNVWAFLAKDDDDDSLSFAYQAACVAVLHDTFEDTDLTISYLDGQGIPTYIYHGIQDVTRKPDESYIDFIRRAGNSYYRKYVKLFDLEDNLDVKRLSKLTEDDMKRINKYLKARRILLEIINK